PEKLLQAVCLERPSAILVPPGVRVVEHMPHGDLFRSSDIPVVEEFDELAERTTQFAECG
ncbi:MAG TPA: hypothetical protein VEI99_05035, partial [Terriglobales bacterium]|nr:hypothetical protein [Terriglobales bacterium]